MNKKKNPYEKNILTKCSVCGNVALQDQFGNGECKHCGWEFCKDEEKFEKKYKISYPMLVPVSKAREQYKHGLPFKATFEDFVNGLYFYSEMTFEYQNKIYEVFFKQDYSIVFCSKEFQQEYRTKEDFMSKANINGEFLSDIWQNINNPSFMNCG